MHEHNVNWCNAFVPEYLTRRHCTLCYFIDKSSTKIPRVCIKSLNKIRLDRVKRIWYLSPMRAAKVQASLRIRAVSPEPPLLAHRSSESRGTFRQKIRSLAPLNGWACAVKICHDGMLEDTNSLDGAQTVFVFFFCFFCFFYIRDKHITIGSLYG